MFRGLEVPVAPGFLRIPAHSCGFLRPPEKRANMVRNIRNIFSRNNLTDQEVRTLRGIIVGLTQFAKRR